jgi:linear primary-alkylsulfatase
VPLTDSRDKVLAVAQAALDRKEYAWPAQLVNQLYLLDNQATEVRQLKAECLRQMAYVSTGANDRAHLLSQALALEGKVNIARLIPPPNGAVENSPASFGDYFRVRIDPGKSGATDCSGVCHSESASLRRTSSASMKSSIVDRRPRRRATINGADRLPQ